MKEIILFIMAYIIVYIFYKILIVSKAKRRNSKKRPAEINYLIYKYELDIKKLDYKILLNTVALVSSFDISLIVSIITIVNSFVIQLVIAAIIVIPIFLISYHFVGTYYRKKGCIKNV